MAGSTEQWTLPLARAHEDNAYELVPADPDHDPLLSSTENRENIYLAGSPNFDYYRGVFINRFINRTLNICPRRPKNEFIRKLLRIRYRIQRLPRAIGVLIFILPPLATVLAVIVFTTPPRRHTFARQSATYARAAARYSLKTGRAPPRGYDKWFAFAQEHSCLIDEYDQIQRDFAPFHGLAKDDPLFFQSRVNIAVDVKHLIREAGGLVVKDGQLHMPQGVDLRCAYNIQQSERSVTNRNFFFEHHYFELAHLLPDMTFIVNGKDQPRVVFDYREPGNATRDRFFRERPGCEVIRSVDGFSDVANDDSGFFLSSSPAYFTLDLYPVLSVTKISPCFANIAFPSEYHYQRSSTAPKFAYPDNIPWKDKKAQAYWRGTATGGQIVSANYHNFKRFKLVELSTAHPDLGDAKITRFADLLCLAEDGCDRAKIVQETWLVSASDQNPDLLERNR
ncbi:hypothetical protein B0H16DRAFT_1749298 [Mycena metata]|uniref:Uncharacterized protein n=1 Tax=Mycena metata TaxID=1033252 RepID=A0AAD7DWT6_9AGAR|nr:hypothetical protein B0H16DRAFT_1749298 [Mycena metata]